MIGVPRDQKLPSGLQDEGFEFYVVDSNIYCLHNGRRHSYNEIPEEVFRIIDEDMVKHPEAIKALVDWDMTEQDEMRKQYIYCRFGGFDMEADITPAGTIDHTEYFECGRRGRCSYEGKLCSSIKVENGHLTKQEIRILKLIAVGLLNKQIGDELNISEDTVSSHCQNIQQKTGLKGKPEMAAFAQRKNLV